MINVADQALLRTNATSNYALSSIRCNGVAAASTTVNLYSGRCPSWALCGANGEKRLYRDACVNDGKKWFVMYDPFAQCNILRNLENEMILKVTYDQSGLLIIFSPGFVKCANY
uniref:Uncharacterized protein n=1 Tax=Anopheles atroparvus TaxID=41427 RepID=A0A182JCS8_ANOAO